MKYVFDAGPFIDCRYYFPEIFKNFWSKFNSFAANKEIISVKEVYNEILKGSDIISDWANENKDIFEKPTDDEFSVVKEILSKHKELLRNISITSGTPVADPFVIAKAKINNLIVVTQETLKPNAHKIPNICDELNIKYMNLKGFMNNEVWVF
ncbi:hypothetical protein BMS3Abin03_00970 [bacterium BMS3Abin03]|nr:hypothetical protein BMS3Abin03_00970 [bacterium BMS3Abin03]